MPDAPRKPLPADAIASPPGGDELWRRLAASIDRLRRVGRQANDPAALAQRLAERAKAYRQRAAAAEPAEAALAFLALAKGGQRYGIPLEYVLEVHSLAQFSLVPKAPAFIPGVMPWRGAVLALVDLGKLFGFAEAGLADVHHCVIVEAADRRVAVAAGNIEELRRVPRSQIQPAPELAARVPAEWILGVHDSDRLLLNMDALLHDAAFVRGAPS